MAGAVNAVGTSASFSYPRGLAIDPSDFSLIVGDCSNYLLRRINLGSRDVTTIAGNVAGGYSDSVGTAALFKCTDNVIVSDTGLIYVADFNHCIRAVTRSGVVSTLVGACGSSGFSNGIGTSARFNYPVGFAFSADKSSLFIADGRNYKVRRYTFATSTLSTLAYTFGVIDGMTGFSDGTGVVIDQTAASLWNISQTGDVTRLAGNGVVGYVDGEATAAGFLNPFGAVVDFMTNYIFVADVNDHRIRMIANGYVTTIAGSGLPSFVNGFGTAAGFNQPANIAISPGGTLFVSEQMNNCIRQLTCVPCPASYYCISGVPVLCPAGSYCPMSSINTTQCPKGTYSAAGAATCTLCPPGTFTSTAGSTSCQPCPGGHHCPPGTSSWARLNCGRGNYCPDGSGAPTPCPFQVAPTGGWGALQVQGPAFLVETAHCLNHCFWNFTSGDGMLSKC